MNPRLRHPLVALTALAMVAAPAATTLPVAVADPGTTSMMLVLDASGSMAADDGTGTPKIDSARKSLTSLVNSLPTNARVGMRVLGATVEGTEPMPAEACDDTQRVVDLAQNNQAELISAIGHYSPYGWTPIPKALEEAGKDLGSSGKRSIVLVSDGESTCGDPCPTAESLASSGVDLTIDVVGLSVDATTREQLQCIADKGKGKYYDADNTEDLTRALQQSATDRDVRPFDYDGTSVTGTSNAGSAPTLTPGYWKDTVPATGNDSDTLTRYYVVKRSAKQTDISASVLVTSTAHEQEIEYTKIMSTELLTGNKTCTSGDGDYAGSTYPEPYFLSGAMATGNDYSEDCRDAEQMILKVDLQNFDLTGDRTLQLKIGEWPRVGDVNAQAAAAETADEGDFQDTTSKFGGSPTQIQGGSSLASATSIEQNKLYQSTIVPGEVQTFSVPVGWGQSISSSVSVMPTGGEQGKKLDELDKTNHEPLVSTNIITGAGRKRTKAPCEVRSDGCTAEMSQVTKPATYDMDSASSSAQAGAYTVTVAMSDDETLAGSEFSYQLYVQTVGEILPAPNYQTYEESLTASPSPSASTAKASSSASASSGSSRNSLLALALGSVGVLLLAGGGVGIWYTRRHR
ncbi:vWA domain-containing protein [Propionibacterium australiense]|uniref:VWA domain-containing protein n=1 Tax=Propionibacterium australiense TaxID=119981 RepID=A0A8B3FMJ7_9ACTN|nr:VWA domain-containing protein [Propionibacterium australiense]RLP06934.1 VWA domain-containing protein [Propionibacterium australiense]